MSNSPQRPAEWCLDAATKKPPQKDGISRRCKQLEGRVQLDLISLYGVTRTLLVGQLLHEIALEDRVEILCERSLKRHSRRYQARFDPWGLYRQHSGVVIDLNRPGFTGECLVQLLGRFFSGIQGLIEILLCFFRRDVSDFAV